MTHWYAWFPGDYLRDTQHLSMVEDAAYRRMLDSYYMVGKLSANAEVLLRVCRAVTPEEQAAVRKIAAEFFEERDGLLYKDRVEEGIAKSRAVSRKRSLAGKQGAATTNAKRSASDSATAASSVAANDAASASSIPQPEPEKKNKRRQSASLTFSQFLEECKAKGERGIADHDPLFEYMAAICLPREFGDIAWNAFRRQHTEDPEYRARRQKDWRAHFMNFMRKGGYGLWSRTRDGEWFLTTTGKQAELEQTAEAAA